MRIRGVQQLQLNSSLANDKSVNCRQYEYTQRGHC